MKYSKSAIGLLTREYRSVLKKCLLINLGLFALGAVSVANAAEVTDVAGLNSALSAGGDTTVANDITGINTDITVNGKTNTLNLNGNTLSGATEGNSGYTFSGGSLTLTGGGTISGFNRPTTNPSNTSGSVGAWEIGGTAIMTGGNWTVSNNKAGYGALNIVNGSLTADVDSIVFDSNKSNAQNAALRHDITSTVEAVVEASKVSITANKIEFKNNSYDVGDNYTGYVAGNGSAVLNAEGLLELKGSENIFTNNSMNISVDPNRTYKVGGGAVANQSHSYKVGEVEYATNSTMVIGKADGSSVNTFSGNTSSTNGGAIMNRAVDSDGNATMTINGTTTFSNNSATGLGGAIYNKQQTGRTATLNLNNGSYTFTGNTANSDGGAVWNSGILNISNAVFGDENDAAKGNESITAGGGAIYNEGILNVDNAKFYNNTAKWYGAIRDKKEGTSVTITNSIFKNNSAEETGAVGIFSKNGTSSISGSTFDGNRATATGADVDGSGALFVGSEATLTVSNTTFKDNTSAQQAGAIGTRNYNDNNKAKLDIIGSTFTNNTAATLGGAINNFLSNSTTNSGFVTVKDSTFTSNSAANGGAVYNHKAGDTNQWGDLAKASIVDGKIYISDSDFTGNTATEKGGAIYNAGTATIAADAKDVTFSGNTANNKANDIYNKGTLNLNAASGKKIALNGGIDGDSENRGTVNLTGAGVVETSTIKNQTVAYNAGELHLINADLTGSTVTVASGAIINTIDDVINDYSGSITLADGAKVKGDVNFAEGTADKYAAASGTIHYLVSHLMGAASNGSKTIQVAGEGSTIDISQAIFDSETGMTFASSGSDDGKMIVNGIAGGIEAAADASEDVSYIQYNLTDDEAINTAKEIKDNFVLNGDGVGADDKGVTLNADLGVANGADLALNNLKLDGSAALNNDERGTLRINDSKVGVKVNNAGILISDPTTYNDDITNSGTASFNEDTINAGLNNTGTVSLLNGVKFGDSATITGNGVTNLVSGTTQFATAGTDNSNTINVVSGANWSGIINGGTVNTQNGVIDAITGSVSGTTNLYVDANLGNKEVDTISGGLIKKVNLLASGYGTDSEVTLAGNYDTNVEVDGFSYYTKVEKTDAGLKFSDKLVNQSTLDAKKDLVDVDDAKANKAKVDVSADNKAVTLKVQSSTDSGENWADSASITVNGGTNPNIAITGNTTVTGNLTLSDGAATPHTATLSVGSTGISTGNANLSVGTGSLTAGSFVLNGSDAMTGIDTAPANNAAKLITSAGVYNNTVSNVAASGSTADDGTIAVTKAGTTTNVAVKGWANKQDTLVSGTNIKTVAGSSLLGSGEALTAAQVAAVNSGVTSTLKGQYDTAVAATAGYDGTNTVASAIALKADTAKLQTTTAGATDGYDINAKTLKVAGVDAVTVSGNQTLTNKTIDAESNTISNLGVANLASTSVLKIADVTAEGFNPATLGDSKLATAGAIYTAVNGVINYKQNTWGSKELGYDTATTDAPTKLAALGFVAETETVGEEQVSRLGFLQAVKQNKASIDAYKTLNDARFEDGATAGTKLSVATSIQNRIQGAANGDADNEAITADTKVYSVAGANEAIQAALSDDEQDIVADEITANSVDTQSLKVAIPASTEPATEENVIFEAKAGTADNPNTINLNGKTTVEGGLNVDSITMGEKTVNAISSAMINSTNHNANTLATTEAVYAALGKVDHLITEVEGKATFNGNQGEGYPTLSTFNNNAEGEYRGNLAVGTTVAQDLIELDNVFGMMQDLDETNNLVAYDKDTGKGNVAENLTALDSAIGDVNFSGALIDEVKAATNATDAILALDGYLHIDTGLWNNINALTNNNDRQTGTTATNIGTAIQYLGWRVDDINDHKKMTLADDGKTALIQDDKTVSTNKATFYTKSGADDAFMAKDATIDTNNLSSGVVTSLGKADTALQANDITSGTADGTIKVKGTDVAVAGLGSAAFTAAADYATAAQGALADSSLQGIKTTGSEGYITVDTDSNKLVIGKVAMANLADDVTAASIADGGTGFTTSDQVFDALGAKADATDLADYMKTADYTNSETVDSVTTTYLNANKFKDGSIAQAKVAGLTDALDGKADTGLSNITNTGKGVINDLADARITEAKATSLESTSSTKLATEGQVVTALASKADTGLSNITEAGENKIKSLSTTAIEDKIVTYNTSTNPAEKTVYSAASIKDALDKAGTALQANSALNGAMISAGTVAEGSLAAPVVAKLAKAESSVQGIEAGGENFVTLSANNKLVISKITESHIASSAFDSAPTANSSKLLTSGAVAQAISAYTIKSADTDEFNVSTAGVLSVKKIASSKIDGLGTAAAADIKTSIGSTVADTSDTVVVSEKAVRTELDKKVDNTTLAEYLIKDVDDVTIAKDANGVISVKKIGLDNIADAAFGNIVEDGTNLVRSGVIYTALQGKASLNSDVNFSGLTLGGGAIKATAISDGNEVSLTGTAATYATTLATELTVQNTAKAVDGKIGDLSNLGDHSKYDSSHVAATTVVQAINNLDRYITGTGENTIEDKDHYWTGDNVFKKDVTFQSNITVQGTVDATTVDTENLKIGDATVSSIDKGTTAVAVGTGDATKLATTATVLKSAQNAEFSAGTGETLPTSVGTAGTIHAAIVNVATAVDTLGDKVGTVTFKDADGNPTTNNIAATTTDLTSAVTQLDQAIGKVSSITADYAKTVTTTGSSNPADIATAIQNVATAAAAADGNLNFNQKFTTSDGADAADDGSNKAADLTTAINNVAKNAAAAIENAVGDVEAQIHGDANTHKNIEIGDKAETVIVGSSYVDTSDPTNPETVITAGMGIDTVGREVEIAAVNENSEVGADFDAKNEKVTVSAGNDETGNTTGMEIDNKGQSITMTSSDADYITTGMEISNKSGTRTVTLGTKTENASGDELSHYTLEIDGEKKTTTIGSGDGKEVVIGEGTVLADKSVTVGDNAVVIDDNGNITAQGTLAVQGDAWLNNAHVVNDLGVGRDASVGRDLAVAGVSNLHDTSVDGNFAVTGQSYLKTTSVDGALTVSGDAKVNALVIGEEFATSIDNGTTAVEGEGSSHALATTATVMASAENAKFSSEDMTGVTQGTETLHDAIEALDSAMGTMVLNTGNKNLVDNTGAALDNATDALNALDAVMGNITDLDVTKGNLDGSKKEVASHLAALDNRLGSIKAIDGGDFGNLADADSDVATHFGSLDVAMGDRTAYNNADNFTGYVAQNDGSKDLTTMISEVASNIGKAGDITSTNQISAQQTVNANLSSLDAAIGNVGALSEELGATDLTSAINNLNTKVNESNGAFSKAINKLDMDQRKLRHDFEAGMAGQAALSALVPNAKASGNTQLAVGTGAYKGHTAAAVGGFHWFTDNLLFNAGVAWDNNEATGRMGITYSW